MGFEPTCRLRDKTLSRRPRYDHFGTSPLEDQATIRGAWPGNFEPLIIAGRRREAQIRYSFRPRGTDWQRTSSAGDICACMRVPLRRPIVRCITLLLMGLALTACGGPEATRRGTPPPSGADASARATPARAGGVCDEIPCIIGVSSHAATRLGGHSRTSPHRGEVPKWS